MKFHPMALFRSKKKTPQEHLVEASNLNTADDLAFAEKLLSRPSVNESQQFPSSPTDSQQGKEGSDAQYTHGLEDIYAIETIDVSTVRPMGSGSVAPAVSESIEETDPIALVEVEEPVVTPQDKQDEIALPSVQVPSTPVEVRSEPAHELELDLGEAFRGWMPSMVLDEPVAVLGLSTQATEALEQAGMTTLRDLVTTRRDGATSLDGIGQGHFDEMAQRLDAYVKGRDQEQCHHVDFRCLVRCLLSDVTAPEAYLATERYQLSGLFPLTAAQDMELRRVTEDQKESRRKGVMTKLNTEQRRTVLAEKLHQITNVFVKPWIRSRYGLATDLEVAERVEGISTDVQTARNVLRWVSDVFQVKDPVNSELHRITDGVLAADDETVEQYGALLALVRTYFYDPKVRYGLQELITRLSRELAVRWEHLDPQFIEKTLRHAPAFQVHKAPSGHSEVSLSPWMKG